MSCFERAHSAVGSLITTRVLYGCSVWTDAPTALLKKVEALIIDHHCGTPSIGYWSEQRMTILGAASSIGLSSAHCQAWLFFLLSSFTPGVQSRTWMAP